jgi:hypothetical protein
MELSLHQPLLAQGQGMDDVPLIYGNARGTELTLIASRPFDFLQPFTAFVVLDAVVGAHLTPDQLKFAEASVGIDRLVEWAPSGGLQTKIHNPLAKSGDPALEVSYTAQPPLEGRLMDGTHVRLDSFPRSSWGPGRFSVAVGASLRLRPRKPVEAAELATSRVIPLQDLVSWATQQPASVTSAYLRQTLGSEPLEWLRAWRRSSVQADEGTRGNIRFYASDFSPTFGSGVQRWMATRKLCSEALALLVSLLFAAPRYTDTALLLTAQALEAYHRAKFPNRRWSPREFKFRKDAVLQRLDGKDDLELQKWVAELLRYANEPSLSERLQALETKAQPVLNDLFKRRPMWHRQLKDMRNKFTHRGRKPPDYGANELFQVARFGRLVLDVCLILDLGIPPEVCRARVEQWSDFSWAMSEAATN